MTTYYVNKSGSFKEIREDTWILRYKLEALVEKKAHIQNRLAKRAARQNTILKLA